MLPVSAPGFKVLSIADNIKKYSPELSDADIRAFVWYNRTLGIPMTGFEQWFIANTVQNTITAKYDVDFMDQQWQPVGKFQKGDTIGKLTRFEHKYNSKVYVVVRRINGDLVIVLKDALDTEEKYEVKAEELDDLVKQKALLYLNGSYVPLHVYTSTDYEVLRKALLDDREHIIEHYGMEVFDYHKSIISGYTSMRLDHPIRDKRYRLNPFGEIARETMTTYEEAEMSVDKAFQYWAQTLKESDFELVSKSVFRERIIRNDRDAHTAGLKDDAKDEKEQEERKEIADAVLECDRLFSEFCVDHLSHDTLMVLNRKINETYNRSILVNTSKVPVGFVSSSMFKYDAFKLKAVQVDAFKFAVSRNNWCLALTIGFGKGNKLTSNVLSPDGWVKMGTVKVGDNVVGKNGLPTKIIGVYPLGKVQCYKVTFSDGSYTEVSDNHLWSVQTFYEREKRSKQYGQWKTVETKDIKDNLYNKAGNYRYSIPMVDPVEFTERPVPIPPYMLGILLGDGSMRKTSIGFSNPEIDIQNRMSESLPTGITLKENTAPGRKHGLNFRLSSGKNNTVNTILLSLRELKLDNAVSNSKFIPDIYKFNSSKVRLEVLRGLLDTDGYITSNRNSKKKTAGCSLIHTTVSKQLCDDIVFLVQSFGGTCVVNEKLPTFRYKGEKKTGQLAYNITIRMPGNISPISSHKQIGKYRAKTKYQPIRFIKSIEDIGFHEAQCIKVDAPDELYVCDDFIVTHNTSVAISILSYLITTGTIKKPMITVPKPVLKNWEKELFGYWENPEGNTTSIHPQKGWTRVYGILTDCGFEYTSIANLAKPYLKTAKALKGRTRCIVLSTYEALEKMYISDPEIRMFVIARWKDILDNTPPGQVDSKRKTAKKIAELIGKLNQVDQEADVAFDQIGIDSIYFDEAHRLKNMFSGVAADKTNKVNSGFKGSPSARALRAFYLSQYLTKINGRIGFLSATPFSNSPLEVYTMLCFLNYAELVRNNVYKIQKFVEIFFNETTEYKVTDKNKIVVESVMKSYKNKPILYKILANTFIYRDNPKLADIQRPCIVRYPNKELKLMLKQSTLQKMQRDTLIGKMDREDFERLELSHPELQEYITNFKERLMELRFSQKTGRKLGEKALGGKILSCSKSSAVSPFCNSPVALDFMTDQPWKELYLYSPKIRFTIDAISLMTKYHANRSEKSSSFLIYIGLGINILEPLKQALEQICGYSRKQVLKLDEDDDDEDIKGGKIRYDEVEIISGSSSTDKEANRRERIGELFNKGFVKVLIGTDTIKEGLNLQVNCATLFILAPTWNSTDINQVEGRIHRQGNQFAFARVITPLVTQTLDSFIFQKYDEKRKRLSDIWQDDGISSTEAMNVEIPAEKQKELILDDSWEIAKIRANINGKKFRNELNKLQDSYDSLVSALAKSDSYKKLVGYFTEKLPAINEILQNNLTIIKTLIENWGKDTPEYLKPRKDRLANLKDYYGELIDKVIIAMQSNQVVDLINIFTGSFKGRDYMLYIQWENEADFVKYCKALGLNNVKDLLLREMFYSIGIVKNDQPGYYTYDSLIEVYSQAALAQKYILEPEGLTLSSPMDQLNAVKEKFAQQVIDKRVAINTNFEVDEDNELTVRDEYLQELERSARIELDEENKLAKNDDILASYFCQRTDDQLSYKIKDVDLEKCDIPHALVDEDNLSAAVNLDEIKNDYSAYKRLYLEMKRVIINLDTIETGAHETSGEMGDAIMPLSVEAQTLIKELNPFSQFAGIKIIMEHNYLQNGDLMTDPRIDFAVYQHEGLAIPLNYEINGMGTYNEYVENGKLKDQKNLNKTVKFCIDAWFPNLVEQGRTVPVGMVGEKVAGGKKGKKKKDQTHTGGGHNRNEKPGGTGGSGGGTGPAPAPAPGPSAPDQDINTIGDAFFIDHPDQILGEMSISDYMGMIQVKGTKEDVIKYFNHLFETQPPKEEKPAFKPKVEEVMTPTMQLGKYIYLRKLPDGTFTGVIHEDDGSERLIKITAPIDVVQKAWDTYKKTPFVPEPEEDEQEPEVEEPEYEFIRDTRHTPSEDPVRFSYATVCNEWLKKLDLYNTYEWIRIDEYASSAIIPEGVYAVQKLNHKNYLTKGVFESRLANLDSNEEIEPVEEIIPPVEEKPVEHQAETDNEKKERFYNEFIERGFPESVASSNAGGLLKALQFRFVAMDSLHTGNKNYREMWSRETGVELPNTQGGTRAAINDYFNSIGGGKTEEKPEPKPEPKKEKKFTFYADKPMQLGKAIPILEKKILTEGRAGVIMPKYEWLEKMPRGMKTEKAGKRIYEPNENSFWELKTQTEFDYYEYIDAGGYPYSSYLADQKAEKEIQDTKKKIEHDEREVIDAEKRKREWLDEQERKYKEIALLLENGTYDTIKRRTKHYYDALHDLKSKRQTDSVKKDIEDYERYIKQTKEQVEHDYDIAKNSYEMKDGRAVKKNSFQVGDKVGAVVTDRYDDNGKEIYKIVPTVITEIREPTSMNFDKSYVVEQKEGIYNKHMGYNSIRPLEVEKEAPKKEEKPAPKEEPKPAKTKEERRISIEKQIKALNSTLKYSKDPTAKAKVEKLVNSLTKVLKYL